MARREVVQGQSSTVTSIFKTVNQQQLLEALGGLISLFFSRTSHDGHELVFLSKWECARIPSQNIEYFVSTAVKFTLQHRHDSDCCAHQKTVAFKRIDVPDPAGDIDRTMQRKECEEHRLKVQIWLDPQVLVDVLEKRWELVLERFEEQCVRSRNL
jgi:heme-degrading monooxygenase HmoA